MSIILIESPQSLEKPSQQFAVAQDTFKHRPS